MHEQFKKWILAEFDRRFWSKVKRGSDSDCWLWIGHRLPKGYGAFKAPGGALLKAHRVSYEYANGPIPPGRLVLHRCDNPPCVNPAHLWVGSNDENMADMVAKGRSPRQTGSKHHAAILTEADVVEIRQRVAAGEKQADVARDFGLHRQSVYQIVTRRNWKHI